MPSDILKKLCYRIKKLKCGKKTFANNIQALIFISICAYQSDSTYSGEKHEQNPGVAILIENADNATRSPALWIPIETFHHHWASGLALSLVLSARPEAHTTAGMVLFQVSLL